MAEIDRLLLEALAERDAVRRRRLLASALPTSSAIAASTLEAIVEVLRSDGDLDARNGAMEVLGALGDSALETIALLMDDDNVGIRRLAVDVLGVSPTRRALPLLERAAKDVSTTVRAAALDGVARVGGPEAIRVLQRQLEADAPGPVALAALLGIDQLGALIPSQTAKRWLDNALTSGAALRLLGRAGDLEAVVPSLLSPSRLRSRAATLGLHEGLEKGARLSRDAVTPEALAVLVAAAATSDASAASAAVVVLAHLGSADGLHGAVARDDASAILPALHRAVELMERAGIQVTNTLAGMTTGREGTAVIDVVRELDDAARRRRRSKVTSRAVPQVPLLGDVTFARLVAWFASSAGLAIAPDARTRVEARLLPRLETRGVTTFDDYVVLLAQDAVEAASAVDAVTIHETYFFREPGSLDGLRDEIGPKLGQGDASLRVWSAGCSSGEEAYTLAGILWDLRQQGKVKDFEVLGTDISPLSIEAARRGRFGPRSFRHRLTAEERATFEEDDAGLRQPTAELRRRVQFKVLNLVDDTALSALPVFDLIFCRNVLIYLTTAARKNVLQAFHGRLRPGGALVLGHSESLLHVENPFELWPMGRGLAYRRGDS